MMNQRTQVEQEYAQKTVTVKEIGTVIFLQDSVQADLNVITESYPMPSGYLDLKKPSVSSTLLMPWEILIFNLKMSQWNAKIR